MDIISFTIGWTIGEIVAYIYVQHFCSYQEDTYIRV